MNCTVFLEENINVMLLAQNYWYRYKPHAIEKIVILIRVFVLSFVFKYSLIHKHCILYKQGYVNMMTVSSKDLHMKNSTAGKTDSQIVTIDPSKLT